MENHRANIDNRWQINNYCYYYFNARVPNRVITCGTWKYGAFNFTTWNPTIIRHSVSAIHSRWSGHFSGEWPPTTRLMTTARIWATQTCCRRSVHTTNPCTRIPRIPLTKKYCRRQINIYYYNLNHQDYRC